MPDFIMNGQGYGGVAQQLLSCNMDPGVLRPFIGNDGGTYITVNENGKLITRPVHNATATLRKDEWKLMDEAIIRVAKPRLRLFGDLRSAGLQFVIPNGMAKTVLEYERQSDITPATMSMDGIRRSESDRPVYDLKTLPLPITHKDFHFSARQLSVSRNGSTPLDTTTAELAARRVVEEIEKLTLGVRASYAYGGGTVYGITNFPQRLTKTITAPDGTNAATTVKEILAMKQQSVDNFHYGPWNLYNSPLWDQYLDDDYSTAKGDNTLRERIAKIDGVTSPKTLDYLTGTQLILVEQASDVIRAVVGMDLTTVQWETHGGMEINFKVMAIMVPQIRADINNQTGIVHGSV